MTTQVRTVCLNGIEALEVGVQVQIAKGGLPCFNIVGLPNKTVDESKERIRAALADSGLAFPNRRITVNLAPAHVVKDGSHFDLPIALGILAEMDIIDRQKFDDYIVMGELGLDGALSPTPGVLPAAVKASELNCGIICPKDQGSEAAWADNQRILAAPNLVSLLNHFKGEQLISRPEISLDEGEPSYIDFADIRGQESAKRAAEIAAAGGHNVLMIGPPGCGKSMLAEAINSILPPLTSKEILEISMIHSIAGLISEGRLIAKRPYRKPHHSTTMAGMIGSSTYGRANPGEISFAHNGVLFLDELPEFPRATLESLRQPIESGQVLIARASSHITYPAKFQLVVAMNPCRCGYLGVRGLECSRAPRCGEEYQAKISGPFLDRIDIHIEMQAVPVERMTEKNDHAEKSATVARRVAAAIKTQAKRYQGLDFQKNAEVDAQTLEQSVLLDDESQEMIKEAAKKMDFSARGYHRALRVARTIADLEKSEAVKKHHVLEALSYRRIVHR